MNKTINLSYYDLENKKLKNINFPCSLIKEEYKEKELFLLSIDGKSMENIIPDASLVLATLNIKDLELNKIYVIENNKKLWVKIFKYINNEYIFSSINKDYTHIFFYKKDVRVIARFLSIVKD